MKILLIEDEYSVISTIEKGLKKLSYEISVAMDGIMGLKMAKENDFDLLILDVMLPGLNGLEVCQRLRNEGSLVPIILLSSLNTVANIVAGLDYGADDYVVKTPDIAELNARIKAITRRGKQTSVSSGLLRIADLEINILSKTVMRAGKVISLTATEFRLLEFFARNQNRVFSRIELLENVWDLDFNMGTNVVDVYINYLRKKIDVGHEIKLIHTVIGMGYVVKIDPIVKTDPLYENA
jgi:DNA-binding response OmpR family regulator